MDSAAMLSAPKFNRQIRLNGSSIKGPNPTNLPVRAPISSLSVARTSFLSTLKSECVSLKSSLFEDGIRSSFNGRDIRNVVDSLNLEHSSNSRGALGAQMNLFQRLGRIVSSYANAAISAAEDPEKILEQAVLEMSDDLIKMRQATAQVLATQKQIENRYKQSAQTSDDWYRRAKLALEKGDEELAKEALKRRKEYEDSAKALKAQLDQQSGVVEKLISNTRMLEDKIAEAKAKKDTLKARAQSARTSQKVNEMVGNISTSSALAAFEKMEEKVIAMEAESEAVSQIASDDLSRKFVLLEGESVDDELLALKRDLRGAGTLPPGKSKYSAMTEKEIEIESELNELRRKAREL